MDVKTVTITSIGVVVNFAAITTLVLSPQRAPSYQNVYLNLAIADFLFSLRRLIRDVLCWNSREGVCLILRFILDKVMMNINLLCVIPVITDRVMAVLYPTLYCSRCHSNLSRGLIIMCWLLPLGWITIEIIVIRGRIITLEYVQEDKLTVFLVAEAIFFCVIPTLFNITSFIFIIRYLWKSRKSSTRVLSFYITVAKGLLISLLYTLSWLPMVVMFQVHAVNHPQAFHYLYLNTIFNPFLYLIPNRYIESFLLKLKRALRERNWAW